MLQFLILFLIFSISLHLLIYFNINLYAIRRLYVLAVYFILKPLIYVSAKGTALSVYFKDGTALIVDISKDCTGWKSFIALISLILSTPPRLLRNKKCYGILIFTPFVVFILTTFRILTSILLSYLLSPSYFPFIHGVLWKALSLLIVIITWFVWFGWCSR